MRLGAVVSIPPELLSARLGFSSGRRSRTWPTYRAMFFQNWTNSASVMLRSLERRDHLPHRLDEILEFKPVVAEANHGVLQGGTGQAGYHDSANPNYRHARCGDEFRPVELSTPSTASNAVGSCFFFLIISLSFSHTDFLLPLLEFRHRVPESYPLVGPLSNKRSNNMADGVGVHELIVTAAIVIGFGVTVIMFRVERETRLQDESDKVLELRIAGADWLIFVSTSLAVLAIVFLLWSPRPVMQWQKSVAAIANVVAVFLQLGYIFAILAHYGISIGEGKLTDERPPWGKTETKIVYGFFAAAAVLITALACIHIHSR
jgi:multisubunit Na+/H+ antiporter MnhC subunit